MALVYLKVLWESDDKYKLNFASWNAEGVFIFLLYFFVFIDWLLYLRVYVL